MNRSKVIWTAIFIIGILFRVSHVLQPVNTNSWREADVATIERNFYVNKTDIFHPQINYGGSGPGYTESEFQIYSYLVSLCYRIFGIWEPLGRIISLLFSLATMIVFFRLCNYIMDQRSAFLSSFFFAVSPVLSIISIGIQPEAATFFFYVWAAYLFIHWLDTGNTRTYWLTFIAATLALLAKIPAVNIGIFFCLLIIARKGWKFLFTTKVIILGILIVLPPAIWYWYSKHFYLEYGNSLGLSNEYPWIGWDFFTNISFIKGIISLEIENVWTLAGPLIVVLAMITTRVRKIPGFRLGLAWYVSAFFFYIITCRTTASDWAWYYHIFSAGAVSLLLGMSVVALYDGYIVKAISKRYKLPGKSLFKILLVAIACSGLFAFYMLLSFKNLVRTKNSVYHVSEFYSCAKKMQQIIPGNAIILVTGGPAKDQNGYSLAVPAGYFFYWLDRKGYCISTEDLSTENILAYQKLGVEYFVAEETKLASAPHLEDQLKHEFTVLYDRHGCVLFRL